MKAGALAATNTGPLSVANSELSTRIFLVLDPACPKGNLTVYVLNKGLKEQDLTLMLRNLNKSYTFYRYQVTESKVKQSGFKLNPKGKLDLSGKSVSFKDKLPPLSITTFSTYELYHSNPGVMTD